MTMVASLPFRANKRFTLYGETVCPGDVVDVSTLSVQRVHALERGNYGMRVAVEGPLPEQAAVARPKGRKPSPVVIDDGASAEE